MNPMHKNEKPEYIVLRSVLRYFDQFINAINKNIWKKFSESLEGPTKKVPFHCSFLKYDLLHSSTRDVNLLSFLSVYPLVPLTSACSTCQREKV